MNGKFASYAALLTVAAFLAAGCATTSVDVIPIASHEGRIDALNLGDIRLESIYSYTEDMAELELIIVSSAKKAGLTIMPRANASESLNAIRFFLREKSYIKGFKTMLSLAILAEISAPDGAILYRASYLHDGTETFDSLKYVNKAMDALFRDLSGELRKRGAIEGGDDSDGSGKTDES